MVESTTTGEDAHRSHFPAGKRWYGKGAPVVTDQRRRPVPSATAKIRPPLVAAITSPPATAGDASTGPPAWKRHATVPARRSMA